MRQREEIPSLGEMPQPPVRRIGAADKARLMIEATVTPAAVEPTLPAEFLPDMEGVTWKKLTTRIPAEQLEWLKGEAKRYRTRNPKAPKITIEEFICIAIDHLREAKNLDQIIAKHRS